MRNIFFVNPHIHHGQRFLVLHATVAFISIKQLRVTYAKDKHQDLGSTTATTQGRI